MVRVKSALRLTARQPPEAEDPHHDRVLTEHLTATVRERLNQAVETGPVE